MPNIARYVQSCTRRTVCPPDPARGFLSGTLRGFEVFRRQVSILTVIVGITVCHVGWSKTPSNTQAPNDASGAIKPEEVGINEKLGQVIPLDLVLRDEDRSEE